MHAPEDDALIVLTMQKSSVIFTTHISVESLHMAHVS